MRATHHILKQIFLPKARHITLGIVFFSDTLNVDRYTAYPSTVLKHFNPTEWAITQSNSREARMMH